MIWIFPSFRCLGAHVISLHPQAYSSLHPFASSTVLGQTKQLMRESHSKSKKLKNRREFLSFCTAMIAIPKHTWISPICICATMMAAQIKSQADGECCTRSSSQVQSCGLVVIVTNATSALGNQSQKLPHGHQHHSAQLQITQLVLTRQQKWKNQPLRHRSGAKLGSIPTWCVMVGCISDLMVRHKSVWSVVQMQGHVPRMTQSWSEKQSPTEVIITLTDRRP